MANRDATGARLRVAVLGASATVETSWWGGPRTDLAYPRVLEAELRAAGRPADVRVHALPANRIRHGRRDWVDTAMAWAPDAVVLHFGQADNVHLFLPRWLERHANSPRQRPGAVRGWYRRRVVRPVWIFLAKAQQRLDPRLVSLSVGRRQRRQVTELLDLIRLVRATSDAEVLVVDLLRPGPPWANWMPGCPSRMAEFNRQAADAIARLGDPLVQIVPVTTIVPAVLGPDEELTPDGGHYTPEVHRIVGAALADDILAVRP